MPMLSHQWADKKPFTRRVQWLCDDIAVDRNAGVVLKFEDADGYTRHWYGSDVEAAKRDWNAFKDGIKGTQQLRSEYGRSVSRS